MIILLILRKELSFIPKLSSSGSVAGWTKGEEEKLDENQTPLKDTIYSVKDQEVCICLNKLFDLAFANSKHYIRRPKPFLPSRI